MASVFFPGRDVMSALLGALGIDPEGVTRLVIEVEIDDVARVTVERLAEKSLAGEGTLAALSGLGAVIVERGASSHDR